MGDTTTVSSPDLTQEEIDAAADQAAADQAAADQAAADQAAGDQAAADAAAQAAAGGAASSKVTIQANQNEEVFICKYVGTPGVNEVLQTGDNPILVSVNTLPEGATVGSVFADGQGRSLVLAFATGQDPEPDPGACPPTLPTLTPVTAVAPTVNAATCDMDGSLVLPVTLGVIYTVDPTPYTAPGDYTVTATAATGYVLTAPASYNVTVGEQLTGGECVPPAKVFVCKFVGKPGVDERLQTGQNPISVSVNAIPGYVKGDPASSLIGFEFADKQGRSLVIAVDTGQEKPDASQCIPTPPPPPPPPPPPAPTEGLLPDTGGAPLWMLLMGGVLTAGGVVLLGGARGRVALDGSWGGDTGFSLALPPQSRPRLR